MNLDNEKWRTVVGYEGRYWVSSEGRVRSPRGIRKLQVGSNGNMAVKLSRSRTDRKTHSIQSLVAAAFLGPRPEGMRVRHLTTDRLDNRLENLAYATPSEIMRLPDHWQKRKTHCPQGHPYDDANTYIKVDSLDRKGRLCRACSTSRVKARRALDGTGPAKHGSGKYISEKCRCDICREGHRVAHLGALRVRYALVAEHGLPSHVKHSSTAYRNWGCRCDICQLAASHDTIQRRLTKTVAAGEACFFEGCTLAPKTDGLCKQHAYQVKKGEPLQAVPFREGRKSVGSIDDHGYVRIRDAKHPNAGKKGVIKEHRRIMAEILGRPLAPGENVHHKNGVRSDNCPENLELWVVSQPCGQRPADLVSWAREIIDRYGAMVDHETEDRVTSGLAPNRRS